MQKEEIMALIIEAVEELLRDKGEEAEVGPDFQLFGSESTIDSLDLVAIVVRLEENILDKTGRTLEIVDENSVVSDDSPFRTVATMTELVASKLAA